MHSAKEQEEWESVEGMDERELHQEVVDLRREVADLKAELDAERTANAPAHLPGEEKTNE